MGECTKDSSKGISGGVLTKERESYLLGKATGIALARVAATGKDFERLMSEEEKIIRDELMGARQSKYIKNEGEFA